MIVAIHTLFDLATDPEEMMKIFFNKLTIISIFLIRKFLISSIDR